MLVELRTISRNVFQSSRQWCGLAAWLSCAVAGAPAAESFQRAPPEVRAVLDAPPTPSVSFAPTRDRFLLLQGLRYPPLADLAEPMLRLAGARINPQNNGPHRVPRYESVRIVNMADGRERKLDLPANARLSFPVWSPDGQRFAFVKYEAGRCELWVGEAASGALRQLKRVVINGAFGEAFQWTPDSQSLLCQTIPRLRGKPPAPPQVPAGPVVQQNLGKPTPVRTYQDTLENPHDEALFDHYATSQLARVNARTGSVTPLGKPAIFTGYEPSPDGRHLLVVRVERPYSYSLPASQFPKTVEVWGQAGEVEFTLARLPATEEVPIGGVMPGPRSYHWRPTASATLVWVEPLDGGNPRKKVPHRDRVMMLAAPFKGTPQELARTEQRFSSLSWGEKSSVALLRDYQSSKRWSRTFLLNPDQPGAPELLWEHSSQDRYADPGAPLTKTLPNGARAMRVWENSLFLGGTGASPAGDRPFLDKFDLVTRQQERLFQCDEQSYESVVALVKDDGSQFITRRETPTEPPNYFLRAPRSGGRTALTRFTDPAPQLRAIQKRLVTYQRDDGVALSFTLYLPPGYQPGTRLPTVVWAYPREFTDADTAGQISGSTNRFTTISGISHLFFTLQGYAVLDGATMPVVGDPRKANDTYLTQIVASAKAAIDKAVALGVTDPARVGVGGHSYGAFMTANLLAHSDLFRAGIARSGAYNRTLTPFGFQNERRTLWEAPDMYLKNSPFLAANKLKEPLLLIHGEADNNSGTFPLQSERFFEALKGTGGTVRLVMLPYESHAYEARESVEHTLHEMFAWFDRYVKGSNAAPTATDK
jgi:dipeptidyl aminopeptidase/acylaminoacyl peptidase